MSTKETISELGLVNSAAKIAPAGTLLMAMYGQGKTRGKTSMLSIDAAMNQACAAIQPHAGVDPQFLLAYLRHNYEMIRALSNAGGQENLSGEIVKKIPVVLPNTNEQARIAEASEDAARLIDYLERLVAKKQAIKQGMMQQLLTGKTRLPGFTEPWQPRRFGNMLGYEQPGRYLVQTSQQRDAGRVPVLTAGKTFILGYTNEADGIYTAHPVVIFDDFTTASKYVDFDFKAKSSAMKILSARPGVDLRFIYERMQLIDFPLGDHKRYWISEYSKQELDVPSHSEQRAISAIVTDADEEVDLLRRRLAKARATKTGMMQQLLTGRARLPAEAAS